MLSIKNLLLTVLLVGLAFSLQAQSTDTFDLDQTYSIDKGGTISLNSDDAEVTIVGSARSDVRVKVHYLLNVTGFSFGERTRFDMTVSEQNGNLVIEEQPRDFDGVTFGSTDEEYTIMIEAPQEVNLNITGDDEQIEIQKMNGRIKVDADDASADLKGCEGNAFVFRLDDGTIRMDGGKGKLKIDGDDSEATIRNANFDSIDLRSDDGDFSIHTGLSGGGSYNFDMDDGELEFYVTGGGGTVNIRHDDADISAARAFRRTLNEENESTFELDGGTAMVRIDVDDADIELRSSN